MKTSTIIIEDNVEYCNEIIEKLRLIENVQVLGCFHSLEDALAFLDRGQTADFFLVDIGLPGMDGISGIGEILMRNPETKIAMLTIFDDKELVFNALKNGACGYLLKGESEGRFQKAIEEIVSGGGFFTPSIAQMVLKFFRKKPFSKHKITKREKEILQLMSDGLAKKQISDRLFISYSTVDSHVKNIYKKLHVNCGVQAVMKANEEGLI
ncbi:MAG: response regulator transcription factor [Bacteroidales bacterium]|nr:response regulator transcription factor [Bacteroidales bacterium]MCF8454810.1 response regulator transcription factor [Bacteroidales bacterium]